MIRRARVVVRALAMPIVAILLMAGLLAACGGGGDAEEGATDASTDASTPGSDSTSSATPEPEEPEETIGPGSEISLGEAAPLTWSPRRKLESSVEVVVKGIRRADIADFKAFKLDAATKSSKAYYVTVAATNTGTTNPGGFELPLYLDNGSDVLFPPAKFNGEFKPCGQRLLPKKFRPGNKATLCLVFLAAKGTSLKAVAMRPDEKTEPILWSGRIAKPKN